MTRIDSRLTRRMLLGAATALVAVPWIRPQDARAAPAGSRSMARGLPFASAMARGISDATYTRVMGRLEPNMNVFSQMRNQPEFNEQTWQYINRRVSDWRIIAGKEALKKKRRGIHPHRARLRCRTRHAVGAVGRRDAFGDPLVQQNHMRPVFPSLAALAWNEPRRRTYWETELINALKIVQRGWSTPDEMRGSWAGAMGHTQWMPEVWLNVGFDYDGDGRVSPFGKPDDALGSTARYLVNRGKYHRNEHWGYEVRAAECPRGRQPQLRGLGRSWRHSRRWSAVPAARRQRAAVDAGAGRPFVPARAELLRGAQLQSVDELCAGDLSISATASSAAAHSSSPSPAQNAR